MKNKTIIQQIIIGISLLFILLNPLYVQANSTESEYKQVSNQILVSPYNMEGKSGWYVCTTNCEPWGLKEGEWHKHLDDFKWEGHLPTAPVEVYLTNQEGETVEKIEQKPKIDKDALIKEGFKKGNEVGYKDGLEFKEYHDNLTEAQEFIIQGYKEGYKQGYQKGTKEREVSLNETQIKEKGKKDGYDSYRYGEKKNYLSSKKNEYATMSIYQKAFDEGWNQAQQEFYQKYPFIKWFEWNYEGITILHLSGAFLLLVIYVTIKAKQAKKKKLEEFIYSNAKEDEKKSKKKLK